MHPPSRRQLADSQHQSDLEVSIDTGQDSTENHVPESVGGLPGLVGRLFRLPWVGSEPVDHDRGRQLRRAVRAEDIPRVRKMLREGVGVNESQEASLACIATRRQNLELLDVLIQAQVDINQGDRRNRASRTRTPLQEAARKGWVPGVEALLAAGAHVDQQDDAGATALVLAVRAGKIECVRRLLAAGASPAGMPRARVSPIHEAPTPLIAALLLDAGADPNTPDASGATPLHHAARAGRQAMVDFLLSRGAAVDATDARGRSPVFFVGGKGEAVGVFERLLAAGANTGLRDEERNNFVHLAATRTANPRTLEWLYGKEPGMWMVKNSAGETACDILLTRGFHALAARIAHDNEEQVRRAKTLEVKRYSLFEPPPE